MVNKDTVDIYKRLKEFSIELNKPMCTKGRFVPLRQFGDKFIYTSGHGCMEREEIKYIGKIGEDVTLEEGIWSARQCVINILSSFHNNIGDLNKIKRVIKILGFIASSNNFYDQPKVMDGASNLLIDIFGEKSGKAARSAIGVNVLPNNQPVEVEMIFELK